MTLHENENMEIGGSLGEYSVLLTLVIPETNVEFVKIFPWNHDVVTVAKEKD